MRERRPGAAVRLSVAGFVAIAVTWGPARNGFGLFLPDIRADFDLSTAALGLVASALYAANLLAVLAVAVLVSAVGPRVLVLAALACAATGMTVVAAAGSVWLLTIGVMVTGLSPSLSWAPYNDAAAALVAPGRRARVLSTVTAGTGAGMAAAGLTALVVGQQWRLAWVAFAVAAVLAAVPNALVLPGRRTTAAAVGSGEATGRLVPAGARPLLAVAAFSGVSTAVYFSFAVDLVVQAGGLPHAVAGPLLFVVMGVAGLVGLLTGDALALLGLRWVVGAAFALIGSAACLLGATPASAPAVGVSAAAFGIGVMTMAALLSIWSSQVYPGRATVGFSVTLVAYGAGLTVGPAALGAVAGAFGLGVTFVATGAVTVAAGFAVPVVGGWRARRPVTADRGSAVRS